MDNNLQTSIEKQLNYYSIDIEYWTPDSTDTFMTFGYRVFLQENIADLTEAQLAKLHETDQRVLALAAVEYENITSDDVEFLGLIADVINGVEMPKNTA